MSRTKTRRCRTNGRKSRVKEKAGNDIKEKEGKKREAQKKNGGRVRADALLHTRCSECYV